MPQGSPILQFLRGMTRDELDAVRKRCDWCRVRTYDDKQDLSKRIRKSIKRSVESGDLTYAEAMADIRREVLIPGPYSTENTIRKTLHETPVSAPVGDVRLIEEWFSAQLFGALNAKVQSPHEVFLEYPLNHQTRSQADIYVQNTDNRGDFLIEIKRGGEIDNGERVKRQLKKYHRDIDERHDLNRRKTFFCLIGEGREAEVGATTDGITSLSDFFEVPSTLDEIESDIGDLEVVCNTLAIR